VFFGVLVMLPAMPGLRTAYADIGAGIDADAAPWHAEVSDYANAPAFLVAVDKQAQQLTAFERQSPMRVFAEYPITSGKATGDKLREGDHKTPEGVYFVTRHITSGLDFTLYGKEAYPVNYPNPVDRLRKKTGGGIWLHGKGIPLAPRDTLGCVAMNNEDIAALGRKIDIGQPVAFASTLSAQSVPSAGRSADIARLDALVRDWAESWSARSARLFDFYDAEAYTLSGSGDFQAFRAQKERLFKALVWVRTSVSEVQILEGPGYWVTWFNQDYQASNLATSGTRRLYWQKDSRGEFRIVGMEWLPGLQSPVRLAARGQAELPAAAPEPVRLAVPVPVAAADKKAVEKAAPDAPDGNGLAQDEALLILEQWRSSWERGIVEDYARFYTHDAKQDGRGLKQFLARKKHFWSTAKPGSVVLEDITLTPTQNGCRARFLQTYTNTAGYSDKGFKTLIMERRDGILRIVREDWTPVEINDE
jgi:murein L,D-transpeptidase YafK